MEKRLATSILGIALIVAACASGASAKKKPDLVPAAAGLGGKPFAFIGKRYRFHVDDVTANRGSKRAGPTLTRVSLRPTRGKGDNVVASRAVGPIKPGKRDQGRVQPRGDNDLVPGAYKVVICVDAKDQERESNERNNCGKVSPAKFYSTFREWEGTLGGTAPGGGLFGSDHSWSTSGGTLAAYQFDQYIGGGFFTYEVAGGAVKFTTQGSSGGCSYAGTGTFALDRNLGQMMINYQQGVYTITASVTPGASYSVAQNCSGTITNFNNPVSPGVLVALNRQLQFGSTSLAGALGVPGTSTTYSWKLAGQQ